MKLKNLTEAVKALDKKTPSVGELAKKYDVPVEDVQKALDKGTKVEMEHSTDKKVAEEIALDHLGEALDYYDELEEMEEDIEEDKKEDKKEDKSEDKKDDDKDDDKKEDKKEDKSEDKKDDDKEKE